MGILFYKVNYMIRNILKYSILFGLIFGLVACDKLIFDSIDNSPEDNSKVEAKVYLSVTTRAAHVNGEESINDDAVDFEDRVHDLAMFVFDNTSGELVGNPYFDSNIPITQNSKTFVAQLTPGQRDFYFVANMPMSEMLTIDSRLGLEPYMKNTVDLDVDLYLRASETKGFPMSRIYLNQTVTEGGTIYQPTPFKPVVNGVAEQSVKLRRVVAQLQINISAEQIGVVENVYFKNAFQKFSLLALDAPISSPDYHVLEANGNLLRKSGNSYIYYMPEALMSSPSWATSTDHKPINYFVIVTEVATYEIPIITYEGTIANSDYLSFARGEQTDKPDYNIYRNHRYVYTVNIHQDIEIDYTINPWVLKKSLFFMGYGYNVGVDDDGNVTINNTVEACDPHKVILKTTSGFEFVGGGTEKEFANTDPSASATYTVTPVPTTGQDYLQVYYNDALVKTFKK